MPRARTSDHAGADHVEGDKNLSRPKLSAVQAETIKQDVELLPAAKTVSAKITVSSHVYDLDTSRLTTVVPAASMLNR
jgi:hypothetical protein